ncbi:MAG: beta-propeller domain-containing protein, partial [Xanthomonadales bacterium]|nr:beta-propeller domain-containing protein [Xanthomonadales bacterium]
MGALRFLLVLVFLLPATVGHTAERLSNGYTQHPEAFFRAGFWYDPQDPGWGIDLHRSGGRLVATWATYDAEGHPVWYLGIGEPGAETWTLPLTRYTRDGESVSGEAVGQLEIEFDSGYQATMAWTLGEHSGSYRIEPLVVGDAPIAEDRTGYWYEADRPGYGMSISTQADWVLSVFLFYNDAGEPRWVWADNIETDESTRLRALTFSGPCPGCESSPVAATPAGNLNLRFRAENYAELDTNLVVETDQESFTWLTSNRVINLLSDRASGREQAFRLAQFTNEETLLSYLRIGMIDPGPYSYAAADAVFSPAPVAAEVSSTNLQVAGVDEADVVKTDGAHVYALDQFTPEPPTVRVLAMGDAGELVEINRLAAPEDRFINGLYLVNDRPDDRPDLLIMTFGRWDYHIFSEWFSPYPWATTDSGFRAFDVSDPAQPELVADVVLEGGTVETRRIGETLYIVSRAHIHDPAVAAAGSADQAVVAQALGPDDLLPAIRVNDQEALLVNAETTFLPPQPPGFRYPELLTVSAFDLSRPDDLPVTVTMARLAEAVHVSRENLYVATSRFASSIDP